MYSFFEAREPDVGLSNSRTDYFRKPGCYPGATNDSIKVTKVLLEAGATMEA